MFVRLLVLWIYLMATSLHIVGAFAIPLNRCRETPAQARVLSAEVDLRFEYDALGRRVAKINEYGKAENHKITRFLWDGNVPLHEWSYPFSERPKTVDSSEGKRSYASPEPQTELTTWIFDEGTFVPSAKLVGERRYSIISDYLGTPIEAYDEEGKRVWARELDIYGRTRSEVGEIGFIPFLYQGQYLDRETGLAYNRFRYYSPETGAYISQDPIRLEAGLTNLYAYVHDVNVWVDPWGLVKTPTKKLQQNWFRYVGSKHIHSDMHHGFPEEFSDRFQRIAGIDVNNPKYYYNLPKDKHTKIPGVHTNSSRTGKNWNKVWSGILDKVESMNLSQNDAKEFLEARLRELARKERIGKYNSQSVRNSNKHH